MPNDENHYVELSFDLTDRAAFLEWARDHVPDALLSDPEQTTAGTILDAMMRLTGDIPGLNCYGGGAHTGLSDRMPVRGRTPVFHRHLAEHAHPDGGKPHTHDQLRGSGDGRPGRYYFAPGDAPVRHAIHEDEAYMDAHDPSEGPTCGECGRVLDRTP
jgi:hypothetical protein